MTNELLQALSRYHEAKSELESLVERIFLETSLVEIRGIAFRVLGIVKDKPEYLRVKGSGEQEYRVHIDQCTPVNQQEQP